MNVNYLMQSRKEKGYSRKDISLELGVSQTIVYQWEKGNRVPKASIIIKLCKLLSMDANILLGINNGGEYEEI